MKKKIPYIYRRGATPTDRAIKKEKDIQQPYVDLCHKVDRPRGVKCFWKPLLPHDDAPPLLARQTDRQTDR